MGPSGPCHCLGPTLPLACVSAFSVFITTSLFFCLHSHNERRNTFLHPVTGQVPEENKKFNLKTYVCPHWLLDLSRLPHPHPHCHFAAGKGKEGVWRAEGVRVSHLSPEEWKLLRAIQLVDLTHFSQCLPDLRLEE